MKVCLIGDGEVGKTTFLKRHLTGEFTTNYKPTLGVEVYPYTYIPTENEEFTFNIWDCAGVEKFSGLRDGYYIGAQGAIVFADFTSLETLENALKWKRDFKRICPKGKCVLVISKCDVRKEEKKIKTEHIAQIRKQFDSVYMISSKSNYNYEKPFLALLK